MKRFGKLVCVLTLVLAAKGAVAQEIAGSIRGNGCGPKRRNCVQGESDGDVVCALRAAQRTGGVLHRVHP